MSRLLQAAQNIVDLCGIEVQLGFRGYQHVMSLKQPGSPDLCCALVCSMCA